MAVGFAPAVADDMLDAYANGTAWPGLAGHFIQLHVGDPGADGTANVAAEATRQAASFGAPAGAGSVANDAVVEWLNVSTTETYTHFTDWSAATAGTFQGSGTITDGAVTAGTDFSADVGALVVNLNVAAA